MSEEKLKFIHDAEESLEGFESIDNTSMAIPFIRLAQDLTPQTKKTKDEYIEGLEPGMFFNVTTRETFKKFGFIVLKFERMYIEWKPNRGGMVSYHTVENAERLAIDKTFGAWKTAEGNDLTEYYVYYGLIEGKEEEGIVVLSLASTAIKVGKEWNRLMTTYMIEGPNGEKKRAMPYYLIFDVESQHKQKGENDWFVPKISYSRTIDGKVKLINEKQYALITGERKHLPNKQADYTLIEGPKEDSGSSGMTAEDDDL